MRFFIVPMLICVSWCAGTTKVVNISNPSGVTLYHYAVELIITDQIKWGQIDALFSSLRFFEGENAIDYWIEFLDYDNHKAIVWVRIPELPGAGTTLSMHYSPEPTAPYVPVSYVAICPRPANRLTLKSYPLDASGANFSGCHPCVVRAPAGSWISKAKTGDNQNVFWVMSDTIYAPDTMAQALNPSWTRLKTENPALWVCSSEDPTTDNWDWPTGTANWPYEDSGSDFDKSLHRIHPVLHPAGTNSNLIAAPPPGAPPWSDPTMIWIPASNTLRIYFRYNITGNPLYYCDITSPIDEAWSDAEGVSHLTFMYGQCTIGGQPYINSRVYPSGEMLSPSVFYSEKLGKYVLLTQPFVDAVPYDKPIVTLTSADGLDWTVLNSASLNNPTGYQRSLWHLGAMEAGNKWFLFGSMSVSMTQRTQPHRIMCWVSNDNGSSWEIQFPSCMPKENSFYANPAYYKMQFDSSYRPWPVWDENVNGFMLFCGSVQTGDGITTGCLGGIMAVKDSTWSPYYKRSVSPINSVFSIMGVDFSDYLSQEITSGSLTWPVIARDYANTQTDFTLTSDAGCQILNTSQMSMLWFVQDFPADTHVRYRMKTEAANRPENKSISTIPRYFPGAKIFTASTPADNSLRAKVYDHRGPIPSSPAQLSSMYSVAEPFTIAVTCIQSPLAVSKMQILRHNGYDSEMASFITPYTGLSSGYWPTGVTGNFGVQDSLSGKATTLYWVFAKPAVINEPIARIYSPVESFISRPNQGDCVWPDGTAIEDLLVLTAAWSSTQGQEVYCSCCDSDANGIIDILDFAVFATNWFKGSE